MSMSVVKSSVLPEFLPLYQDGWRNIVYFSGRSCLAGGTPVVMANGNTKAVEELRQGDKVISYDEYSGEFVENAVAHVAVAGQCPKPMIEWTYEGETQTVTYDHPYFCGQGFYPLYQLIWGSLDESQRRQLTLLCEQYGTSLDFKLERVKHSCCNSTCERCQRLPANRPRWADYQGSQDNCSNLLSKAREYGYSESPKRRQKRQSSRKPRVVHEAIQQRLSCRRTAKAEGHAEIFAKRDRSHSQLLRQAHCRLTEDGQAESQGLQRFVQDAPTSAKGLFARIVHSSFKVSPWRLYYGVELARAPFTYVIGNRHHFITHNTGKTYAVAESQLVRGMSRRMRFLDCREYQTSIGDSVKAQLESIIDRNGWDKWFVSQKNRLYCTTTGSEWAFIGLHNASSVQSYAEFDEAWVEEAQSLSQLSLDLLTPTIRKDGSRLIFTMNRLTENDPVYEKYVRNHPPRTYAKYLDPYTLDRYGLQPLAMREERESEKGTPSYAWKWLGEPLSQVENAILNRDAIIRMFDRRGEGDGAWRVGIDVARFGADRSVFTIAKGLDVMDIRVHEKQSLTNQANMVEELVGHFKADGCRIKIDDTGVGGGLTDMLKARGLDVVPVNFAQGAKVGDKYPNAATEMWFDFADIINAVGMESVAKFKNELVGEMASRQWEFDSKGRRKVQSKDDYKSATGNRSPDIADSLLLCFYEPKTPKKVSWWG